MLRCLDDVVMVRYPRRLSSAGSDAVSEMELNLFHLSPSKCRGGGRARVRRWKLADRRPVEFLAAMSEQIKETVA
jgi:hypothetical protein